MTPFLCSDGNQEETGLYLRCLPFFLFLRRELLASWLFIIGSFMFVVDGVLENLQSVSFSSVLHLSASILFTIGSIFFVSK